MKKIFFIAFILISGLASAQVPWFLPVHTITHVPPKTVPEDSVFVVQAPSRDVMNNGGPITLVPASAGGGAALTYYEVDLILEYEGGDPLWIVDTILLNTFPGTWSTGGGSVADFEFICTGCTGVDFSDQPGLPKELFDTNVALLFPAGSPTPYFVYKRESDVDQVEVIVKTASGTDLAAEDMAIIPYLRISFRYYHD